MSLPVVFLPQAQDDIDRAYLEYEQQRRGLGARFTSALQTQIARIEGNPSSYGVIYQDIRATLLRRFPYVVYYRIAANQVVIIAVQHGSRDWSSWQSRV